MNPSSFEINETFTVKNLSRLPDNWTALSSAAAFCLILPLYYRNEIPNRAEMVLAAGLDRYAGGFHEGDVLDLIVRAKAYLALDFKDNVNYSIGDLREALRLHAGRLLEGRSRDALYAMAFLATHVLSLCGKSDVEEAELWVLNQAMIDAKPISSLYSTIEGIAVEQVLSESGISKSLGKWGTGAYVEVPVGDAKMLYQISQYDALLYRMFQKYNYGPIPSWSVDGTSFGAYAQAVDVLNKKAYPFLVNFYKNNFDDFLRLPILFSCLIVNPKLDSAQYSWSHESAVKIKITVFEEVKAFFDEVDIFNPMIGLRILEFIAGEMRRSSVADNTQIMNAINPYLQKAIHDPYIHMIATVFRGICGLSPHAQHYDKKYIMTDISS